MVTNNSKSDLPLETVFPIFFVEMQRVRIILVSSLYRLTENLDKFRVGSEFITVCGVHGGENGELCEADEDFRYEYEMMYKWFKNHRNLD